MFTFLLTAIAHFGSWPLPPGRFFGQHNRRRGESVPRFSQFSGKQELKRTERVGGLRQSE
jgi:hypothetical protein